MFDRMAAELARQRRTVVAAELREFADADRAFHAILIESAGNSILNDVYGSLRDRQMRMIGESAVRDPARIETILAEHTLIAEALRDGDLDRSLDAIRTHLAGTERALGFTAQSPRPLVGHVVELVRVRPDPAGFAWSRAAITVMSSPSSSKSNNSKFDFIRSGETDFGKTMSPR